MDGMAMVGRIILILLLFPSLSWGATYLDDAFDSYANITAVSSAGWGVQQEASLETDGCYTGKCIKLTYDGSWTQFTNGAIQAAGGEFYIRFYSKLVNKTNQWSKFIKLFGTGYDTAYSNVTIFNGGYTSPGIERFQHGGTGYPAGDAACINRWDGYTSCNGTAVTTGTQFTFPDENWHKFVIHIKLNTNGNADGIFEMWIDDVLKSAWTEVTNRSDNNTRSFESVSFGDWTTGTPAQTWSLWYDDIKIASTYAEANGAADPAPGSRSSIVITPNGMGMIRAAGGMGVQ
jgi:hypothetical protein